MKFFFSIQSDAHLSTCHYALQLVMREAISLGIIDFAVTCGHRGKEQQDLLYPKKTRVKWPDSKHNRKPAEAVDVVPCIDGALSWEYVHCCVLAGIIMAVAKKLSVPIRWGGDWDMDGIPITDQDFQDLVHYELVLENREPKGATYKYGDKS